jgi:hypothetical protein
LEAGDETGDEHSPAGHQTYVDPLVISMRPSANCAESIKCRNTSRRSEVAVGATAHCNTFQFRQAPLSRNFNRQWKQPR